VKGAPLIERVYVPIDVWDLATFDEALLTELDSERDLLRDYALTETRQFLEREAAGGWVPHKSNAYAERRNYFLERVIMPMMEERTLRAWHHTRLTDNETALLKSEGIHVSSLETIRRRLDVQVSAGLPTGEQADALYAASPFRQRGETRSGKFWMTAYPRATRGDSGVDLLFQHWGGEGVYFWLEKHPELVELVKKMGRPRAIELAVPLRVTRAAYSAAQSVVATLVRTLGGEPDWADFDLYTMSALGPESVLQIHTEGEPDFAALAHGYPAGFINRRT
jgi:hypothetical protein